MTATLTRLIAPGELHEFDAALSEFFDEREARAIALGPGYRRLWAAARQASAGGKRLRPALVLGVYGALAGDEPDDAIAVAVAFELLHTAFLLHDDVIDRDLVRRGRPNLAGAQAIDAVDRGASDVDAELWGQASAILAGDLLLHSAQYLVAQLDAPTTRRRELLALLDRCVFSTAAGELADVAFGTGVEPAGISAALAMAERKTAGYSFEGPLQAGAILAGAGPHVVGALGAFGRAVGTAFQLRDDLLGTFGEVDATGKSVLSDLRARKITPLIAYARSTSRGRELDRLLAGAIDEERAAVIRALLVECGARAWVERRIASRARAATELIEAPAVPPPLHPLMRRLVAEASERTR